MKKKNKHVVIECEVSQAQEESAAAQEAEAEEAQQKYGLIFIMMIE